MAELGRVAGRILDDGKFLITLGGEHSITSPLVAAAARTAPRASACCRSTRTRICATAIVGERHSHACAMRRTLEYAPLVQVGIRNISEEEVERAAVAQDDDLLRLEHARRPELDRRASSTRCRTRSTSRSIWTASIRRRCRPSARPEPGGLSWRELTALLRRTFERRTVVACDVVELCPIPGLVVAELHRGEARLQAADVQVRPGKKVRRALLAR